MEKRARLPTQAAEWLAAAWNGQAHDAFEGVVLFLGPRTAMPRCCERGLRNDVFQQLAADAGSSNRGRCRGRQSQRDDRRPCFPHRVSSCSRACQHCRMELALPGRANLKLGEQGGEATEQQATG